MAISYRVNHRISVGKFVDLLQRSGLAERRPVDDTECLAGMLNGANLLVTAWDGMRLIGLSRSMTDFHYACYLSDLAVDSEYQRQGIGRDLVERTRKQLRPTCKLVLLSAAPGRPPGACWVACWAGGCRWSNRGSPAPVGRNRLRGRA